MSDDRSITTVIYHDEDLDLQADLRTRVLIVHLGEPGPVIRTRGHAIDYDELELVGHGMFRVIYPDGRVARWSR